MTNYKENVMVTNDKNLRRSNWRKELKREGMANLKKDGITIIREINKTNKEKKYHNSRNQWRD